MMLLGFWHEVALQCAHGPHGGVDGEVEHTEGKNGDGDSDVMSQTGGDSAAAEREEHVGDGGGVGKEQHAKHGGDNAAQNEGAATAKATGATIAKGADDGRYNKAGERAYDPYGMADYFAGAQRLLEVRRSDGELERPRAVDAEVGHAQRVDTRPGRARNGRCGLLAGRGDMDGRLGVRGQRDVAGRGERRSRRRRHCGG